MDIDGEEEDSAQKLWMSKEVRADDVHKSEIAGP